MYIDNQWELIGTTTIDLSNYLQKSDVTIAQGLTTGVPAATVTVGDTTTTIYSEENNVFIAKYNTTSYEDALTAYNAGKVIIAEYISTSADGKIFIPLTRFTTGQFQFEQSYLGGRGNKITVYLSSSSGWFYTSRFGNIVDRDAVISSGDKLIIKDSSDNGVNKYSTLQFGTTTTQYLANDGTWQTIPTISAASALTTGITTGTITINGTTTTFYAPESEDPVYYVEIAVEEDPENEGELITSFVNDDTFESISERIENGEDVKAKINNNLFLNLNLTDNGDSINFTSVASSLDGNISINNLEIYPDNSINTYLTELGNNVKVYQSSYNEKTGQFFVPFVSYSNIIEDLEAKKAVYINLTCVSVSSADTTETNILYKCEGIHYGGFTEDTDLIFTHQRKAGVIDYIIFPSDGSSPYMGTYNPKAYVDSQISAITSTIPTITTTVGLTTGVTIGTIDVSGVTTTFYAPEATSPVQSDWTQTTDTELDFIKNKPAIWDSEDYTVPSGQTYGDSDTKAINAVALNYHNNHAKGNYSVSEGYQGNGNRSVTINGVSTILPYGASGNYSHSEGNYSIASGESSHAEGYYTIASGNYSHAENQNTIASGLYSHAEGKESIASGNSSHSEGNNTKSIGMYSHAEGSSSTASGNVSHAEGGFSVASGMISHAEGNYSIASGQASHAEGSYSVASGSYSHAEGSRTIASGTHAHAEGHVSVASGNYSHAEGFGIIITATLNAAEANSTSYTLSTPVEVSKSNLLAANYMFIVGKNTTGATNSWNNLKPEKITACTVSGNSLTGFSVANTLFTSAITTGAVQIILPRAKNNYVHVEGQGTASYADAQHVAGRWNVQVDGAEVIGNGTDDLHRSNIRTLDWNGNEWLAGKVTVANLTPTADGDLTTKQYVDNAVAGITPDVSTLTPTLDDRYVNVTGDTMTGLLTASTHGIKITNSSDQYRNITVKAYAGYVDNYDTTHSRLLLDDDSGTGNVVISGVATPKDNTDAANKLYVDNSVAGITVPAISATSTLSEGTEIGSIDINGTTTTFYAPEDTKVKQNDITGSTTGMRPVLLSAQSNHNGTITDESLKSDTFLFYKASDSLVITRSSSDDFDGRFVVTDSAGRAQAEILSYKEGTTTQTGIGLISAGNNQPSGVAGNAKGALIIYGEGNWQNVVYALDDRTTEDANHNYVNYLPMVDQAVLAAGVTTGVGSSTVPVYMAAGGELLACTLPTPTTYTMSMTGPTINLLADGVAASTITLPIWDGTLD